MPRGAPPGGRPGAGRPPGSKNKRHASFRDELWAWCRGHGADPYRYLAKVVADKTAVTRDRLFAAKELAQYLEPKLTATKHSGQIEIVQKLARLDTCTDEELAELIEYAERLVNGSSH